MGPAPEPASDMLKTGGSCLEIQVAQKMYDCRADKERRNEEVSKESRKVYKGIRTGSEVIGKRLI